MKDMALQISSSRIIAEGADSNQQRQSELSFKSFGSQPASGHQLVKSDQKVRFASRHSSNNNVTGQKKITIIQKLSDVRGAVTNHLLDIPLE